MSRRSRLAPLAFVFAAGCSTAAEPSASLDAGTTPPLCAERVRTCDDLRALLTGSGLAFACEPGDVSAALTSTGLPPYVTQETERALAQGWELTLPLTARCDVAAQEITAPNVAIGLLVNGVAIYPSHSLEGALFGEDEAARRDACGGAVGGGCAYNVRGVSSCTFGEGVSLASHAAADGSVPLTWKG